MRYNKLYIVPWESHKPKRALTRQGGILRYIKKASFMDRVSVLSSYLIPYIQTYIAQHVQSIQQATHTKCSYGGAQPKLLPGESRKPLAQHCFPSYSCIPRMGRK